MLAHKTIFEGSVAVVRRKNVSPTWSDVKIAILDFDRAGLQGLLQDLYAASKENQAFLHTRMIQWTSRVNERSLCWTRESNEAAGVHYIDP